jgi:MFS family permease
MTIQSMTGHLPDSSATPTGPGRSTGRRPLGIFYGWWIVAAAFLNLFFSVGVIFYGFPVFYPSFIASLGFTRADVTQGFLIGFLVVGLPVGLLAGALIDRVGTRAIILVGAVFTGVPLILMGFMTHLWQYVLLCVVEVVGYTLAGPISNQVLISQWFRARRGRAMGYAYLGLGLGGVMSPPLVNYLIQSFGWRHALEMGGTFILVMLLIVNIAITRSTPHEMGLTADDLPPGSRVPESHSDPAVSTRVPAAIRGINFWLVILGAALVLGAVNVVIQYFILFLKTQGYSTGHAANILSILLAASLGGRVLVGYIADRFRRKNVMALFYLVIGLAIPLLFWAHHPAAAIAFAIIFGFAMGADYMLIPLVVAECFGLESLGKLLALIIMGYTTGQWIAPWTAGWIFDNFHSYSPSWTISAVAGVLGAVAIYAIAPERNRPRAGADAAKM